MSEGGSSASCSADALFLQSSAAESDFATFYSLLNGDNASYAERYAELPALQPAGRFVRRLRASDRGAAFHQKLRCLKPAQRLDELRREHAFDRDLLMLDLQRGRSCQHKLCRSTKCGLHVRDGVVTPEEAAALVAHGEGVLAAAGDDAADARKPYIRVDFMRSAQHGSLSGHVLQLRVAERMRRVAAGAFNLPLERVGLAETLLALRRTDIPPAPPAQPAEARSLSTDRSAVGSTMAERGSERWAEEMSAVADSEDASESFWHVDEALAPHFHFSTILWLSRQGEDFEGGELAFMHNSSVAWLLVEPAVGRAAFFTSGWENVHGIQPLTSGRRWALSVPLFVNDELQGHAQVRRLEAESAQARGEALPHGRRFREHCVTPVDKYAYQQCRAQWAGMLSGERSRH